MAIMRDAANVATSLAWPALRAEIRRTTERGRAALSSMLAVISVLLPQAVSAAGPRCDGPLTDAPYGVDSTGCLPLLPPYVGLNWAFVAALSTLLIEWILIMRTTIGPYAKPAIQGQWLRGAGVSVVIFLAFTAYLEAVVYETTLRSHILASDARLFSREAILEPSTVIFLLHLPALAVFFAAKYLTFVHGFGISVRRKVLSITATATLIGAVAATALSAAVTWR